MRNNEKGFIYPLTLCVYLLFISFFLMMVDLFINEKRLAIESQEVLKQDYYFMSVVKNVETILRQEGTTVSSGSFTFKNATVQYSISNDEADTIKINYVLIADPNYRIVGSSYFDTVSKKMTKWVDSN